MPFLYFQGPNIIPADIIFIVKEKIHPRFKREGDNLIYVASIPLGKVMMLLFAFVIFNRFTRSHFLPSAAFNRANMQQISIQTKLKLGDIK